PLPPWAVLRKAIDRGVNYIDTSESYENGNSERKIGKLFKEIGRDKVQVGTKFHLRKKWSKQSIVRAVNQSLKRLQTDYLDVLLIHGADKPEKLTEERVMAAFEKLKKEGKYRFRGLSCHQNHHQVVKKAVECGYYDMVQVGYNVFDIQEKQKEIEVYEDYLGTSGLRGLIALAKAKDVGVIAMKTLKVGGKRQNLEKYRTGSTSIFQAMLKWVLADKNVTSAVTEMLTFKELEEDLAVVGAPFSRREKKTLVRYVLENSDGYCHLCGLCQSHCPAGIRTTDILHCLAYYESYQKTKLARKAYSQLKSSQTATACQDCGQCEKTCPYGVKVRTKIIRAHTLLS
ncbi:MAG: aldo/keto reductase, partial [Candidatus Aminicenantales bacterium]